MISLASFRKASREYWMRLDFFMKWSTDRAEAYRAVPAVGRHMIGAGHVIAHRFGREISKKDSPGIANRSDVAQRILYLHLQMLRSDPVGKINGSGNIRDDHDGAVPFEGCRGCLTAGKGCQLAVQGS